MKIMNRWTLLVGAAAWVVALAHAGAALAQETDSGFLRDYSRLNEAKDTAGKTIRGWVSPKFTPDNYTAILVEPLLDELAGQAFPELGKYVKAK